jgi:hypothetical protein
MHTRTLLPGWIAGALCAAALQFAFLPYPLLDYVQDATSFPFLQTSITAIFCLLLIIAAGWIASAWTWGESLKDAIRTGAGAGLLAATVAYIFSGTTIAGVLGLEHLIDYGLRPAAEETYSTLLVQAIGYTSARMMEFLYLFMLCGLLCGVLGGLLGHASRLKMGSAPKTLPGRLKIWPGAYILLVGPLAIIVTAAALALLPGLMQEIIIKYNISSFPLPSAILSQPVGVQLGVMAFALGMVWPWLARWWKLRPRTCFTAFLAFLVGLGILAAGYVVITNVLTVGWNIVTTAGLVWPFLFYPLIALVYPIFGFLLGIWLVEKPPVPEEGEDPSAGLLDHTVTIFSMGLAGLFPFWILVSFSLMLAMGVIRFIPALTGETSDVSSVIAIIQPLVNMTTGFALNGLLLFVVIALILKGIVSFFSLPEAQ